MKCVICGYESDKYIDNLDSDEYGYRKYLGVDLSNGMKEHLNIHSKDALIDYLMEFIIKWFSIKSMPDYF